MEKIRDTVIVSYARGGSSLGAIRSLGKRGVRIIAIDSIKCSPGFCSKFTSKAFLIPDPMRNVNSYKNFLKKIFYQEKCLTILPMDEITALVLSKYKHEFEENTDNENVWPDYEPLKIAQDRSRLLKLAEELTMPAPKCYTIEDIERNGVKPPWVIKPRYSIAEKDGSAKVGRVKYVSNVKDLKITVKSMQLEGVSPIIQEFIPGEGYGFFALYNKGNLKACFQHRRLRESPYTGGPSSLRESVRIPELQREGLKIPQELKWHGPIMVEFKRDQRDGKFKLMEVNPRFWGSLNLAIQSGVDFPYLFYQIAKDGDCSNTFYYEISKKYKNLEYEIIHLVSLFKKSELSCAKIKPNYFSSLFSVLTSGLTVKDDYLSANDPLPYISELAYFAERAILGNAT
jgi:predicted ATP-grasp superfamily ATP-dependent carboligase